MGLTLQSTGRQSAGGDFAVKKRQADDLVVALAGNPNVGKSTVFNHLTRCHQHTGNWAGKTVSTAQGNCTRAGRSYICVDLPGCYSLLSHSVEEELARDFLCFGGGDAVAVVCDATCLERNLNLVLQTLEITNRVVVCVNLMDEARRKGTVVDIKRLSAMLGVPVVATAARSGEGLEELLHLLERQAALRSAALAPVHYPAAVEEAVALLRADLEHACGRLLPPRWVALRLLEGDASLEASLAQQLGFSLAESPPVAQALARGGQRLHEGGIHQLGDVITAALVGRAEEIAVACVTQGESSVLRRDRRIDRLLTSRKTGIPVMLLLLGLVFWLTISGANVPSALLSQFFTWVRGGLDVLCAPLPPLLRGVMLDGAYGVLTWVVAVMLPPMAIFFPLFTLLEDLGYLPRVAFNLDKSFQRCHACGKQALTMCMGFGCNAAGVVGCRIIDSPRERLIAILTNSFVPCNGRFPILIALLSVFFVTADNPLLSALLPTLGLLLLVVLGVGMTLLCSRLLSATVLRGVPSSFTLELPPYRRPEIGKVILRSLWDRTLFVLGRAAAVAAPAGVIIWLLANITLGEQTLLAHCAAFLDPVGRFMGLDGVVLLAFVLGFPANEIVLPIAIMAYTASGHLAELENLSSLRLLLTANGWTMTTAVCTLLFSLFHWPCSTTVLSIHGETHSWRWTLLSVLLPTAVGVVLCAVTARILPLFL